MIAEIQRISNIFAILDPTIFPIVIPVAPLRLAEILTTNSGAEVPNATIVSPIIRSEILSFLAIEEAPSTKRSAPLMRIINQIIKSR